METKQRKIFKPEDMNASFAEAYNSGDINNFLALYEPEAILTNTDGGKAQGVPQLRKHLEDLLQLKGKMVSKNIFCIPFEDIALMRAHWTIDTVDKDGNSIQIEGHTSEIVRKQPDGSWLYIVDHPTGSDILEKASLAN
ncbi:SgcJ/EcaC family oxidoreductase [Bacillus gobiensis]|uniref:YybH family protein n=1 Tax=Bacillus gobiensis TaxID=1441095 RepID=UPI003D2195BF